MTLVPSPNIFNVELFHVVVWFVITFVQLLLMEFHLPPKRSSALPWALSRSFLTIHWYIPLSWRVTLLIWRTKALSNLTFPFLSAWRTWPFRNHLIWSIGDPDTVQLNIALSPEFITWKQIQFIFDSTLQLRLSVIIFARVRIMLWNVTCEEMEN